MYLETRGLSLVVVKLFNREVWISITVIFILEDDYQDNTTELCYDDMILRASRPRYSTKSKNVASKMELMDSFEILFLK